MDRGSGTDNVVDYKGENARAPTVRFLSVLEQLERKGKISSHECFAARELAGMLEAGERAVWSMVKLDHTPPAVAHRDPLAAWTRGYAANTAGAPARRRQPPRQMMPYPKKPRQTGDGMTHARIDAMRGTRQANFILGQMPKDVREIVLQIAINDRTVGDVAASLKGYPGGTAHRWVMRRLMRGLKIIASEIAPQLREVA